MDMNMEMDKETQMDTDVDFETGKDTKNCHRIPNHFEQWGKFLRKLVIHIQYTTMQKGGQFLTVGQYSRSMSTAAI